MILQWMFLRKTSKMSECLSLISVTWILSYLTNIDYWNLLWNVSLKSFININKNEQTPLPLNSLNIQKGPRNMTLQIQVLAWDRHNSVAGLNPLMGFQPSPVDNCISNGYAYINKRLKTWTDSLPLYIYQTVHDTEGHITSNIGIEMVIAMCVLGIGSFICLHPNNFIEKKNTRVMPFVK
jgi:hypothetical protein